MSDSIQADDVEDNNGGRWGLPKEFDLNMTIASYRFWLMTKLRFPDSEIFTKRHDNFLVELEAYCKASGLNFVNTQKMVKRVAMAAYNTVKDDFWKNIERARGIGPAGEKIPKNLSVEGAPVVKAKKKNK